MAERPDQQREPERRRHESSTTGGAMDREHGGDGDSRLYAASAEGNRDAILELLREELPARGSVLEIGSGTGQHVVHFANALPTVTWQPTDADPDALASIVAWREHAALQPTSIADPQRLDLLAPHPENYPQFDALLCINVLHIAPWAVASQLFAFGRRQLCDVGAPLLLYGPYLKADGTDAPSNFEFDARLKERDGSFGVRKISDVVQTAERSGFRTTRIQPMPNNNHALVFRTGA